MLKLKRKTTIIATVGHSSFAYFFLSLCLEWNAFGMLDNSFAMFCDGVGSNDALQALDLRNNQISHDGAVELAAALKRNHTLRALGRSTFKT